MLIYKNFMKKYFIALVIIFALILMVIAGVIGVTINNSLKNSVDTLAEGFAGKAIDLDLTEIPRPSPTVTPTPTPTVTPTPDSGNERLTVQVKGQNFDPSKQPDTYAVTYEKINASVKHQLTGTNLQRLTIEDKDFKLEITFPFEGIGLMLTDEAENSQFDTDNFKRVFRWFAGSLVQGDELKNKYIYSTFYGEGAECSHWSPQPAACATHWVNSSGEQSQVGGFSFNAYCQVIGSNKTTALSKCDSLIESLNVEKLKK